MDKVNLEATFHSSPKSEERGKNRFSAKNVKNMKIPQYGNMMLTLKSANPFRRTFVSI